MAHLTKPKLWKKIRRYEFSDLQDGTSFESYLKNTIKVSPETVAAAITEYRRFIYLCMVAPGEMVPSQKVDEVWHAHLILTEDYWERFCPDVLGRKLHHIPGSVGFLESDDYAKTLMRYQREFGKFPPKSFWPRKRRNTKKVLGTIGTVAVVSATIGFGKGVYLFALIITVPLAFPSLLSSKGSRSSGSEGGVWTEDSSCSGVSGCGGD